MRVLDEYRSPDYHHALYNDDDDHALYNDHDDDYHALYNDHDDDYHDLCNARANDRNDHFALSFSTHRRATFSDFGDTTLSN